MAKQWPGSKHCKTLSFCFCCLGIDDYSVRWRRKMRHPKPSAEYDPQRGWFFSRPPDGHDMLPEQELVCPYGRTLADVIHEQNSIAAGRWLPYFQPFVTRLDDPGSLAAFNQLIAEHPNREQIFRLIAAHLGVPLEENP